MGNYYLLQLKRLFRIFPTIFMTILLLVLCLIMVFNIVLNSSAGEESARFKLALVCSEDDPYFKAGLDIVQSYDSSRFAIETLQMDEEEAALRLRQGLLDAYVVIPSGYIGNAMHGQLGSLKYVSSVGAADLSMLFKEEITAVVSDIIIACEKGMYGVDHISADHGINDRSGDIMGKISLQYVDYVLDRSDMYYVEELGIKDSLGFDGYLFSGISILIFTLMLVPAGVFYIKQDISVELLLKSKNIGPAKQIIGEYFALLSVYFVPVLFLSVTASYTSSFLSSDLYRLVQMFSISHLPQIMMVLCTVTAFGYLLFQFANELVGGVLVYFFISLSLCFIAGCLYPTYFFPDTIRNISTFIPQGVCRLMLNSCITGDNNYQYFILLLVYIIVFLAVAYLLRSSRLRLPKR